MPLSHELMRRANVDYLAKDAVQVKPSFTSFPLAHCAVVQGGSLSTMGRPLPKVLILHTGGTLGMDSQAREDA
jgi:L-asparaginase/Glu-tRNA(Gln) amidotransferase subunit D